MKFLQNLHIDTRLVIVPLRKTAADDFAQIRVTSIIFRQKHQMVIPVIPAGNLPVKTGIGRNIDLTAQNRIDTLCPRRTVKIDHTVHCAMVGNRRSRHAQLLDPFYIFFDFIGTVQQAVLCMDVQMCKCHIFVISYSCSV